MTPVATTMPPSTPLQSSSSQVNGDAAASLLRKDDDKAAVVLVAKELTTELLEKLFNDEVCVIRIPGFIPPETRSSLLKYFLEDAKQEVYTHEVYDTVLDEATGEETKVVRQLEFGVIRVGTPFNSTYGKGRDSEDWNKYFAVAEPMMDAMRAAARPYQTPTDKLRQQINELSPFGYACEIPTIDGKSMFCGLARIMVPEESHKQLNVHFDSLPPDHVKIRKQFAANMYLRNSDDGLGGELQIWNVKPVSHDQVQDTEDLDLRTELIKLGIEPIRVRPDPGDLFIFNTRRPHAVGPFQHGLRVQVQCFMGITTGESQKEPEENQQPKIVMWN